MPKKLTRIFLCLTILMCFTFISCATLNTPEKRYAAALTTFNNNLETYLDAYASAPPATQARWKSNINPYIKKASTALDTWHTFLDDGTKEAAYHTAWDQLFSLLLTSNIITIKED